MKVKILCGILALLMSSACIVFVTNNNGSGNIVIPPDSELSSTVMDKPTSGTPSDTDAKSSLFIAAGELQKSGGFKASSSGKSVAMGVEQAVASERTISGGAVFKQTVSYSGIVKIGEQRFMSGQNFIVRGSDSVKSITDVKWKNTAQKISKDAYVSRYGHLGNGLSGYVLNDKTIVSAQAVSSENGEYVFKYELDKDVAPYYMMYEMKTSAGTSGFPVFSKAILTVTMDKDWKVKSIATDCAYKVALMGGVNCQENIVETFSEIGYSGELPEQAFFEQFFGADITEELPEEADALAVLMNIFQPYLTGGEKLNLSLSAENGGVKIADALVSASIDMEKMENTALDVKIGEIYLSYAGGKILIDYKDFKAGTTVEGITQFAGQIFGLLGGSGGANVSIDTDSLLKNLSYETKNGVCTVSLPINLGGINASVKLFASVKEDSYTFTGAEIRVGEVTIKAQPVKAWDVPEKTGEYPELLGIADIIKNGTIALKANVNGSELYAQYDIGKNILNLKIGGLSAVMSDNTLFVSYGEIKLKLALSDIGELIDALSPLLGDISGAALPEIAVEDVLALLNSLKVETSAGRLAFVLDGKTLFAQASFAAVNGRWSADKIDIKFAGVSVSVAPSEAFEFVQVNPNEYVNVTEMVKTYAAPIAALLSGNGFSLQVNGNIETQNGGYSFGADVKYDKHGNIGVEAALKSGQTQVLTAGVKIVGTRLYLDINGVKTAFDTSAFKGGSPNLSGVLSCVYGKSEELDALLDSVNALINKFKNIELSDIDFESIVACFAFNEGKLSATLDGRQFGLDSFDVVLGADGSAVSLGIAGFTFAAMTLDADVSLSVDDSDVALPSDGDYVLKLRLEVLGAEAYITADLLGGKLIAEINYKKESIRAEYANGKLYAIYGGIKLTLNIEDLKNFAKLPFLDTLVTGFDFDLSQILEAIRIDFHGDIPGIFLQTDAFGVSVIFERVGGQLKFGRIDASFGELSAKLTQTSYSAAELDKSADYIDAAQIIAAFSDKISKLLGADGLTLDAALGIDSGLKNYSVKLGLLYNNGLEIKLELAESGNLWATLKLNVSNNVAYIDLNGIRAAINLSSDFNGSLEISDLQLDAFYGISDEIDAVLDAVKNAASSLKTVSVSELFGGLNYDGTKLTISMNGSLLGLSDFEIVLGLSDGVTLSFYGLDIGGLVLGAEAVLDSTDKVADKIDVASYVAEFSANVLGIDAHIKIDLLNSEVLLNAKILNGILALRLYDGKLYAVYGGAAFSLDTSDIASLIQTVSEIIGGEMGLDGLGELDIKSILKSLSVNADGSGCTFTVGVGEIKLSAEFGAGADGLYLLNIGIETGGNIVTVRPEKGYTYSAPDTAGSYADINAVAKKFADSVKELINADGYGIELYGSVAFSQNAYDYTVKLSLSGGIKAIFTLSYGGVNVLGGEVTFADNVLYADVNGLKFAVALDTGSVSNGELTLSETLDSLRGINKDIDFLIDTVLSVSQKLSEEDFDFSKLISSVIFDGALKIEVNGSGLGIGCISLKLYSDGALKADLSCYLNEIRVSLAAGIYAGATTVEAPDKRAYVTDLALKIDELNTVFISLNVLEGVYRLKLGELYVQYSDGAFYVNYNDMFLKGDITALGDIIKRIAAIADEHFGNVTDFDISLFENVDIAAILSTLNLTVDKSQDTASLTLSAFGLDVTLNITGGVAPSVKDVRLPVDVLKKNFVLTLDQPREYCAFAENENYVALETVFDDYFPTLEKLVTTKSWHFDLSCELSVGADQYLLREGSALELVYFGKDDFHMRAKLTVAKWNGNAYVDTMKIDAAYKDGRIFLDYNNLKVTLSMAAIERCISVFDDVLRVVPQLKVLIDDMNAAGGELASNTELMDYSSVLRDASYKDGAFNLVLNGGIFLSKLGDINLTFKTDGNVLSLLLADFVYDTVSVKAANVSVKAQTDGEGIAAIGNFDISSYNNFDSIYELLSAFTVTADDKSFLITGTVAAKLVVSAEFGLTVKVDIEDDGTVYVAVKLARPKLGVLDIKNIVWEDYGGNGYIYFDGKQDTITVRRDSYLKEKWYSTSATLFYDNYLVTEQSAVFTQNIVTHLLELINFKDWINDEIMKKVNGGSGESSAYGIEDVFKSYSYANNRFAARVDLTPMDSLLGVLNLNVSHNSEYALTRLDGDMKLLSDWCTINLGLDLKTPVAGEAKSHTVSLSHW